MSARIDAKTTRSFIEQTQFSRFYGVQVQIALAYQVIEILKTQWIEIESSDLLDAMASAGVHLTDGGDVSSKAYMRVIS